MLDEIHNQEAVQAASQAAAAAVAAQAATAAANLALTTAQTNAGIMHELSAIKTNLALNTQATTNISTLMEKGFNEIHVKQDYTNGKVTTNTAEIIKIKSKAIYDKVIWTICTILVGAVIYLLERNH